MKNNKLVIYFSLLFSIMSNLVIAQDTIVINNEKKQTDIYQSIYYLNDKDSILSIKDILKEEQQSKFVKNVSNPLNTDLGFSSVWIRFSLQNNTGKELFLKLENIDISEIEVYIPTSKSDSFQIKKMGIIYPYGNREVFSRFFIFSISDGKDTNVHTFYIRIKQTIHHEIPLNIGAIQYLLADSIVTDVFFGLVFGIMFIMFLYNLYVYLVIREISYLYYIIHIFISFAFILLMSGYGLLFFWSKYPQTNSIINTIILVSTVAIIIPFSSNVLQTKKYTPKLHKGFKVFTFIIIVNILMFIFIPSVKIELGSLIFMLLFIYVLIVGIAAYFNGNKTVRFYVLGIIVYLIGMTTLFLKFMKIIPVNWFTMHAHYLGIAFEILFFSFALTDKIRFINEENSKAQKESLELIEEQKETLEEKVQERTSELQIASAEIFIQNEELKQQKEALIAINDNLKNNSKLIESQNNELQTQEKELRMLNEQLVAQKNNLSKINNHLEDLVDIKVEK